MAADSTQLTSETTAPLDGLPAPSSWFGSDNQSGVHPLVFSALERANQGSAVAYGSDPITAEMQSRFRELLGPDCVALPTFNGTGANVVALATLLPRWGGVLCASGAHINVDEGGAPEAFLGAKMIAIPTPDAKLRPEHIDASLEGAYDPHHVWPRVVSITQSTELGTLYSIDEVAALCETAHKHGLLVHMDGARIANATAALHTSLRTHTFDAGVDALSFGGTKNGMMFGEAVIFRSRQLGADGEMIRKQTTQLPSKLRFISAQINALLNDDLWIDLGRHANSMAARLHGAVQGTSGVSFPHAPTVNSLFPSIPKAAIEPLQQWCPHYTWNPELNQVRWVTSFATTESDVDRFASGVRAICGAKA